MARFSNNQLVKGLSGKFGKQMVFRTFNERTFLQAAPVMPKSWSEKQKETRVRFRMATGWAKLVLNDPAVREKYTKIAKKLKLPNAYTAAITDYMRKPVVEEIRLLGEPGKRAFRITKEGFDVKTVNVEVVDREGNVVREESLVKDGKGRFVLDWWEGEMRVGVVVGG